MKIAWPRTSDRETSVSRHGSRFLSPLFVPLFPEGRLQLSPKQIQDSPVIRGLCRAPFEPPAAGDTAAGERVNPVDDPAYEAAERPAEQLAVFANIQAITEAEPAAQVFHE